jgi:hypothetical protein
MGKDVGQSVSQQSRPSRLMCALTLATFIVCLFWLRDQGGYEPLVACLGCAAGFFASFDQNGKKHVWPGLLLSILAILAFLDAKFLPSQSTVYPILMSMSMSIISIILVVGGLALLTLTFFSQRLSLSTQQQHKAWITGIMLVVSGIVLQLLPAIFTIFNQPRPSGETSAPSNTAAALTSVPAATPTNAPTDLPTGTPNNSPTISGTLIENFPFQFYDYDGERDPDPAGGTTKITRTYDTTGGQSKALYTLQYEMPDVDEGYGGLQFEFEKPEDLSSYKFIQFTIQFQDTDTRCRVFLRDDQDVQASVLVGDGNFGKQITDIQVVTIPLVPAYNSTDRSKITKVIFSVNTNFTRGAHSFIVSDILFR